MIKTALFTVVLASTVVFAGCSSGEAGELTVSAQATVDSVISNGLTCGAQVVIVNMGQDESQRVHGVLVGQLGQDKLNQIIEERERCSVDDSAEAIKSGEIGEVRQAITDTYKVVFIPELETASAGWSPISIYSDGSTYGYMCGPWYEFPKDYIAEFDNVTNAYSSPNSLRIMGLNAYGRCYIDKDIGTRVYSDNDMRSCFGYWTVWNCGGPMQTGDVRVYHY